MPQGQIEGCSPVLPHTSCHSNSHKEQNYFKFNISTSKLSHYKILFTLTCTVKRNWKEINHFTCCFPALTFRDNIFLKNIFLFGIPILCSGLALRCWQPLGRCFTGEPLSQSGVIPTVPGIPEAADHLCRSLCESCHTSAVSLCPTELRKSHQEQERRDKAEVLCDSFECEFPSLLTKQEQNQSDTTQVCTVCTVQIPSGSADPWETLNPSWIPCSEATTKNIRLNYDKFF